MTGTEIDLLDEIVLGSARGGKAGPPLLVEVVRGLTPEDLPAIQAPPPAEARAQNLVQLRQTHHQLAQLLARGVADQDASLITGYSASYISILKTDPAFAELLSHYSAERELIFADTVEQLRVLGLSFKEELQDRLEKDPAGFSTREILEAMDLLLIKSRPQGAGNGAGGAGIKIEVSFEGSPGVGSGQVNEAPPAVDVEFSEVIDGKS